MPYLQYQVPQPLLGFKVGTNNNGRCDFGSDSSLDDLDPVTYWAIVKLATSTSAGYIASKGTDIKAWRFSNGRQLFKTPRASAQTSTWAAAASEQLTAGVPYFIACAIDFSTSVQLYQCELQDDPAEVGAYEAWGNTVGSGAVTSDAGNNQYFGQDGSLSWGSDFTIYAGGIIPAKLTAAQLKQVKDDKCYSSEVLNFEYINTSGRISDLSRYNNNGNKMGLILPDDYAQQHARQKKAKVYYLPSAGAYTRAVTSAAQSSETFGATVNANAALSAAAQSSAVQSAVANVIGSLAAGAQSTGSQSASANVNASLTQGAQITDSQAGPVQATAAMLIGATGDATLDAIAQAAAALTAGAQSGESWVSAVTGSTTGAFTANTDASEAFAAAVQAITAITGAADAGETISALLTVFNQISAAAESGELFTEKSHLQAAILNNINASVILAANATATAAITAGAIAGASFSYDAQLGWLLGTITLQAAIAATQIESINAVDASTTLDTTVGGSGTSNEA